MSRTETVSQISDSERSKSTTPHAEKGVQLFDGYEDKTSEVKSQFVVLTENQYIGKLKNVFSASNEFMTCDCEEDIVDGANLACGSDSDCINRLTNIECVNDQCGCGDDCLNQRFQNREYADVSIFLTAEKGYGMRANVEIPAHTFIIEYMGEIVDSEEYKERKQKYDAEGMKHFYFMMIQDNEIIDATKKASLGRYCNHSCDPNAYIEKWVVNKRFRMGIFAKRTISKGEEICFDYNVDRYGAEPQKCYCGAANCLGVMGGKTQSETVRLLPHIITEALGVRASDEKKWLKEQKKNGVKVTNDNVDSNVNVEFVKALNLEPLDSSDVGKVSSCLMQPDLDLLVIKRLLERFEMVTDADLKELLFRFNRFHGVQALGHALKTVLSGVSYKKQLNSEQLKVLEMAIYLFEKWPKLKSKNSLQDGEIQESLEDFETKGLPEDLKDKIDHLIEEWSILEVVYRIPKKQEKASSQKVLDDRRNRSSITPSLVSKLPTGPASLTKQPWGDLDVSLVPENRKVKGCPLPPGWEWALDPTTQTRYYFNRIMNTTQWEKPEWSIDKVTKEEDEKRKRKEREREREKARELRDLKVLERERALKRQSELKKEEDRLNMLSNIIAEASRSESDDNEHAKAKSRSKLKSQSRSKSNSSRGAKDVKVNVNKADRVRASTSSNGEKEHKVSGVNHSLDKKWMALFASYVPNILKKYESEIGRDNLKNCAREIVHHLAKKEEKRHTGEPAPSVLSDERKAKIKTFSKEYMAKFMQKFEEKKKRKLESSNPSLKKQKT